MNFLYIHSIVSVRFGLCFITKDMRLKERIFLYKLFIFKTESLSPPDLPVRFFYTL